MQLPNMARGLSCRAQLHKKRPRRWGIGAGGEATESVTRMFTPQRIEKTCWNSAIRAARCCSSSLRLGFRSKALGYWGRRRGYRVSDQDVYSAADRKDVLEFCYPRATVLFIDSSACFHYGSRNSIKPLHHRVVAVVAQVLKPAI